MASAVLSKDNELIYASQRNLFTFFCDRCKARGYKALWADHYRAIKRKSHDTFVVLVCKETGEYLVSSL